MGPFIKCYVIFFWALRFHRYICINIAIFTHFPIFVCFGEQGIE